MESPEKIISLTGFMGAGKSSVGKELARRLGWSFVDLDDEVVLLDGRSIPAIFSESGEDAFRQLEIKALEKVLKMPRGPIVLALGGGTICLDKAREMILTGTHCIFLNASDAEIVGRVGPDTSSRPVFDLARMQKRLPYYRQAHHEISTDGKSVQQVVDEILERQIV